MNNKKYITQSTLYSMAQLLVSGSVIQTFLFENNISESRITLYLSVLQAVQVAVMLIVSLIIDRVENIVKAMAYSIGLQIFMFFPLIYFSAFTEYTVSFKYVVIFIFSIAVNIVQAVYNVVSYKAPFHIIDMSEYGVITGKIGVALGIGGISLSAVMSYFTAQYDYNFIMLLFFCVGFVLLTTAFLLAISYKTVGDFKRDKEKTKVQNLFKYKPFSRLIIPNILRGFSVGILSVAVTLGYLSGIADKSSGAFMALLLQISGVIGCFVFTCITKKNNEGKIIILSSVMLVFTMPFMLVGNSFVIFYIMYFLANFFVNFINYAVPVAIARVIDYDCIGQYSSWRMLLHTLGISISSALAIPMYNFFGGIGTLIIAALCQLLSGTAYFIFLNSIKKCSANE